MSRRGEQQLYDHIAGRVYDAEAALLSTESKRARLGRAFRQRAIPEAAALLSVLDELAGWPGLIWRYDTELGIRASCTAATPTITTDGAGPAVDVWTDDGELDHLCPVALIAVIGAETEAAEHREKWRTIHDNATERVHGVLRQSGRYHPAAGLDPERLKGAEKLLVMAADGEGGLATTHGRPRSATRRSRIRVMRSRST